MCWHVHVRSHKPNGEYCILETMCWYHVNQTCNVMCKCKPHNEIKLIDYWLDQRCNEASVAEILANNSAITVKKLVPDNSFVVACKTDWR